MTRKLLVPIKIEDPQKKINDFLYPVFSQNKMTLRGIKTGKVWDFGLVVLTGNKSENDIFKMIVDSGQKIQSVDLLLKSLKEYIEIMPQYKIGNVVKLKESCEFVDFSIEYQRLTSKK